MAERVKMPVNKDELREQIREAVGQNYGGYDAVEIEPLLDEALEAVAGGQDMCSLMFCSSSNQEA